MEGTNAWCFKLRTTFSKPVIPAAASKWPRLLLLDEPFASVDAHVRLELEDLVARLVEENSITTILVTHDVDEAVYLSDRAITLTGTPATVGMELDIDLPHPRVQVLTRADAQFSQLRNQLYLGLRSQP